MFVSGEVWGSADVDVLSTIISDSLIPAPCERGIEHALGIFEPASVLRASSSASCRNMRLTAITPAAPVNAPRSAPTYPGVALARALKLKSPDNLSEAAWTRRILTKVKTISTWSRLADCRGFLLLAAHFVWDGHGYLMVKTSRPPQCRIKRIWSIRRTNYNNWSIPSFLPR